MCVLTGYSLVAKLSTTTNLLPDRCSQLLRVCRLWQLWAHHGAEGAHWHGAQRRPVAGSCRGVLVLLVLP